MARPASITNEQILEAAREVFLEKGVAATTAEIASRAGVAEGSIFKRFPSKLQLFRQAMNLDLEDPPFLRDLAERLGKGDLRKNLTEFAGEFLQFFRQLLPIIMISWSARESGLPEPLRQPNPPPLRALKRTASYFEAEMRLGRLRRADPEILARLFIGSIQNYVFFEMILKAHDELPMPEETFLRGVVHMLWTGIAPQEKR